jgi:hypothetical protein
MAVRLPSPDNFLMAREARQVAHYRLMRIEQQLKEAFSVKTDAELEYAMMRDNGKHAGLISQFNALHQEFSAADDNFDAACYIQRSRIQDK